MSAARWWLYEPVQDGMAADAPLYDAGETCGAVFPRSRLALLKLAEDPLNYIRRCRAQ